MVFRWECKILPKESGNWRPKVEYLVEIKASDYPHRPHLEGIYVFGYRADGDEYFPKKCKKQTGVFICDREFWCGYGHIWLPVDCKGGELNALYSYNMKGNCALRNASSTKYNGQEYYFSYICILNNGYLDGDYKNGNYFYLPWRPGEKPDYSDWIKIFNMIPDIIEDQLKDGLDSGINEEVIITSEKRYVIKDDAKNKKNENIESINLWERKIEI